MKRSLFLANLNNIPYFSLRVIFKTLKNIFLRLTKCCYHTIKFDHLKGAENKHIILVII